MNLPPGQILVSLPLELYIYNKTYISKHIYVLINTINCTFCSIMVYILCITSFPILNNTQVSMTTSKDLYHIFYIYKSCVMNISIL